MTKLNKEIIEVYISKREETEHVHTIPDKIKSKHGRMEEWKNGRMEEWKNGRMGTRVQ